MATRRLVQVVCDCCRAKGPAVEWLGPAEQRAREAGWRVEVSPHAETTHWCPGCVRDGLAERMLRYLREPRGGRAAAV